jgi:hypothetical protein
MLLTIAGILVLLWLLGFLGHIGGDLVHILIVVAIIVFIYDFIVRRRNTTV